MKQRKQGWQAPFVLPGLLAMLCPSEMVVAAEPELVTVAYIDYQNFLVAQADGSYTGYGADYLHRIAEYTGWTYDFVPMDWPTAYEAVKQGTVDFYCVARNTPERARDFDFSLYQVCNEEMNLYTMPEREIFYADYAAFDGMTIGVLEQSNELHCLKEYAAEHHFSCDIREFPTNNAAIAALDDGAVDAVALVKYSISGKYKLIGNLGVTPAYLMGCEGSPYMDAFNQAQEQLWIDDPTYTHKLEKKYYGEERRTDLLLTREEAAYIANAEPLTVAVSANMAPMEYYDAETESFRGATVEVYERIAAVTGLEFQFVAREDAPILRTQMEAGNVQLIGALAESQIVAGSLHVALTKAFSDHTMSLVAKDIAALDTNAVVAIPAGYPQFRAIAAQHGYADIKEYETFPACVEAVQDGQADLCYILSMCEGYLLDHVSYAHLSAVVCPETEYGVCFGVSLDADPLLLSILNQSLATLSDREINEIIVSNTAAAKPEQTFLDLIVKNSVFLLAVSLVVIALIAFAIIRSQNAHQQKVLNRKLQQHQAFLQHLYDTLPCGVFQYSYEPPHTILNYNAACASIYGYDTEFPVIGQTPDTVVKAETAADFQEQFARCEQAQGSIMYTLPIKRRDGSTGYAECVMDVVETAQGKVFQEVFIDVTERVIHEQTIEKRYLEELHRHGNREQNLLYTACFDMTDRTLTATNIDMPGIYVGMGTVAFVEALRSELIELQTPEAFEDFRTRFTADRLERAYADEQYEQSFDLCRRKDGEFQWLRSTLTLRLNPQNGHLMCFDYIRDITDERIVSEITRKLALSDCDAFLCMDAQTGRCLEYVVGKNGTLTSAKTTYGKTDLIGRMTTHMTDEAKNELIGATAADVVYEHLAHEERYQVYATFTNPDGARTDQSLTYFYLSQQFGIVAMIVSDVTKVRADEVRHAQLLSDALAAAEKADLAKSQFLSRVSHEMRTPLNAIIGFLELAKDAEPDKIAECLASSDLAAKQLLNVINDVLDMSSIESGKMKIANAPFQFRNLIASLTNIYGAQCRQKGIDFETKITTPMADWLVGDELRVNQILMNLLGNAVKFTTEGYIHLCIAAQNMGEDKVFVRLTVTDTGCGISPEMMQRLFHPFEQESATTASKYGGNGLGLSIVKNLVRMMDGTIRVESTLQEGSSFVVDLPFGKSDVAEGMLSSQTTQSLHILAVDDEASERAYMRLVLGRMGIRFDCVSSGAEALVALERSEAAHDRYNVCLLDWRMPEMSGVDTVRGIRAKYGKEMVLIVVSAYDFQQVEATAKDAGANYFLSKPIFQSSLFDLLMTLTGGRLATPKDTPQTWDFTGKRVLLVEDNSLNQIVAKGFLAKFHVTVELAEHGKRAVERFMQAEAGYYDAILMDIQMPEMDGLTATRAIRASDHPDATTIPIIAQSADAFNEDITKALSAGMNAYVAKPIQPNLLAKALAQAFAIGDA